MVDRSQDAKLLNGPFSGLQNPMLVVLQGKGEAKCAALRDSFLAGCGEKLGEVCEREKAALAWKPS